MQYFKTSEVIGLGTNNEALEFLTLVDAAHRYKQPAVVGAPALNKLSVFIDFANRRACFLDVFNRPNAK